MCFSLKYSKKKKQTIFVVDIYRRDELNITLLKNIFVGFHLPFYCLKTILKVIAIQWEDQIPFFLNKNLFKKF